MQLRYVATPFATITLYELFFFAGIEKEIEIERKMEMAMGIGIRIEGRRRYLKEWRWKEVETEIPEGMEIER